MNPSHFSPSGQAADTVRPDVRRHPVENVAWFDAVGFCLQLTDLPAERAAGRVYRLPTEVEWEYACRGGVCRSSFPYGRTITTRVANFRDNARQRSSSRRRHTTPVGSYPPNGFGLHDMVGNIWEWCLDWYSSTSYATHPPVDPPGPPEGERATPAAERTTWRRARAVGRPQQLRAGAARQRPGFRVLCEWGRRRDEPTTRPGTTGQTRDE
ncbi:MAG: SUMF1/EgtB/PvdO family nonheme iron enzyme [Gemmataceae bacterium]